MNQDYLPTMNYLTNLFPLHAVSLNLNSIKLAFLIVGLLNFLLLRFSKNKKTISRYLLGFFDHQNHVNTRDSKPAPAPETAGAVVFNQRLCRGDLEIVLGRLGMNSGGSEETRMDSQEILNLLEGKNPSLDEVREAFDVFDENRDGFLGSEDLQRVLWALGFEEGLSLDKCRRMIHAFDQDGDERLDFQEFVKFMESN